LEGIDLGIIGGLIKVESKKQGVGIWVTNEHPFDDFQGGKREWPMSRC